MFNNPVLDVVIGLIFIYLLYSLLATTIQEMIAVKFAFRAKVLERAVMRMLEDGKTTDKHNNFLGRIKGLFRLFARTNPLKDKTVAAWFYGHPLIKYLGEDNYYSKPAYLSAQNFSKVMVDLLKGFGDGPENDIQRIHESVQRGTIYQLPVNVVSDKMNPAMQAIRLQLGITDDNEATRPINPGDTVAINMDTKLYLQSIWQEAGADITKFRTCLENWYDDTMQRTTGWYKRYTGLILFILGLILAVTFNVDTISIARKLTRDPKLREQVVQTANVYLERNNQLSERINEMKKGGASPDDYKNIAGNSDSLTKKSNELLESAGKMMKNDIANANNLMGLGWHEEKDHPHGFFHGFLCFKCNKQDSSCIIGWLLTAFAISFGAPFWFDLLNKLMKLRGSVTKSSSTDDGGSSTGAATPVSVTVTTQNSGDAVG